MKIIIATVVLSIIGVLVVFGKSFFLNLSLQKKIQMKNNLQDEGGLADELNPFQGDVLRLLGCETLKGIQSIITMQKSIDFFAKYLK